LSVSGAQGTYSDTELTFSARCSYLTSEAWAEDPKYRTIQEEFRRPLREALKKRFDRFAVLRRWNFRHPEECTFDVERVQAEGGAIPSAVEAKLLADLFDPSALERLVVDRAGESRLIGDLLGELTEPPSSNVGEAIPFLGNTAMYEEILKIAARGTVVLNVGGTWVGRQQEHESDEEALRHIYSRAYGPGQEMRQVQLGLPAAVGGTTVTGPTPRPLVMTLYPPEEMETTGSAPILEGGGPGVVPSPASDDSPTIIRPIPAATQTRRTDKPNTGINLIGYFERWQIPSGTTLDRTTVEFEGLTVQQIKQILQRLPSSVKAWLEVSYPKEDAQP